MRETKGPLDSVERAFSCLVIALLCACSTPSSGGDAGDASCAFCGVDAGPSIDPFGDASLALRTRALFGGCQGGPESGCHFEHAGNMYLKLDPDGGDVINVPSSEMPSLVRVAPYHPETSYLYWKVSADPRIDGGVMPLNAPFDPRIPALVNAWIEAGAP
jgi:hypothetical protein